MSNSTTLGLMTDQERAILPGVLTTIITHAASQYYKASDCEGKCKYRMGPEVFDEERRVLKCFLGAIIKDAYYRPDIEDESLSSHDVRLAVERSLNLTVPMTDQFREVLARLQRIHDNHEPEAWSGELRKEIQMLADLLMVPFTTGDFVNAWDEGCRQRRERKERTLHHPDE